MITQQILNELMSFVPDPYLTTTLYLHIDGSSQQSHLIELKDLMKDGCRRLEASELDPEIETSVRADFQRIKDYVNLEFAKSGVQTLIISSCSARKFWRVVTLNMPFGSHLSVNSKPFIKPLSLLLDEFGRFLIILVERSRARIFEMYAGDIQEHTAVLDSVPGKVRMGGFSGYEEKRISRHIEDHVRRHFRNVADEAFELYKKAHHGHVILLGSEQNTGEFRHYLPGTLQDRIAGSQPVEINAGLSTVLQASLSIEQEIKAKRDAELLDRLFNQAGAGGLAALGLESTIRALQRGQVNYLLVEEGFERQGYRCLECQSLVTGNGNCDNCGSGIHEIPDIVEEAVRMALLQGSQVKSITISDKRFQAAGRIGAMLRFKV